MFRRAGQVVPRVDLVARATADLPQGHLLAMGGHHHDIADLAPELIPASPLEDDRPAPFYLIANRHLRRPVRRGDPVTFADVAIPDSSPLLCLRREQDASFKTTLVGIADASA